MDRDELCICRGNPAEPPHPDLAPTEGPWPGRLLSPRGRYQWLEPLVPARGGRLWLWIQDLQKAGFLEPTVLDHAQAWTSQAWFAAMLPPTPSTRVTEHVPIGRSLGGTKKRSRGALGSCGSSRRIFSDGRQSLPRSWGSCPAGSSHWSPLGSSPSQRS